MSQGIASNRGRTQSQKGEKRRPVGVVQTVFIPKQGSSRRFRFKHLFFMFLLKVILANVK